MLEVNLVISVPNTGPFCGKFTLEPAATVAELSSGINAKKSAALNIPAGPGMPVGPNEPVEPFGPVTPCCPLGPMFPVGPVGP